MNTMSTVEKHCRLGSLGTYVSLQVCKARCVALGMPYFGLQYGRECRCGDYTPLGDPAGNCVSPCTGDR